MDVESMPYFVQAPKAGDSVKGRDEEADTFRKTVDGSVDGRQCTCNATYLT